MTMLDDVRLLDCSDGVAGAYVARLFVDAGADVVRIESPEGAELRRRSSRPVPVRGHGPLFGFLAAGTRSATGSVGDERVEALLADADVAVVDATLDAGTVLAAADRHPHLVVVSIRPYGLRGPWADRAADEFLVQADAGSILARGRPDRSPIQAGGEIFDWTAACYAAPPALAALDRARRTGVGDIVDVAVAEATAIAASTFSDLAAQMSGRTELGRRSVETPSIEPAADGWVGFNTNTGQQFQSFCLLIERPDLMESEWANLGTRAARLDEWNEIVHAWTTRHPVAEIVERASELRIPAARVNDAPGVFAEDHLRERGFFAAAGDGFLAPRSPRFVDGERPPVPVPAPAIGAHDDEVSPRDERPTIAAAGSADPDDRPLAGLRVLDLTSWWAGPSSTQVMAALGADVIHVESVTHPDGMRLTGMMFGGDDWWEWGHMFVAANNDKRGLTLDLAGPAGRELLLRLVDTADLLVENFSPRVIEGFDLDWDVLHARNPRLVMVRMPAFGLDGPWRDRVGFAQTMEQMSGMAWLTGEPDDQPRIMRGPCDPIAGMHGAFAALLALRQRDRTGVGVRVESPMIEGALNCSAEMLVEWSANGTNFERLGNRSRIRAPQGVYPTLGEEEWLAVSVATDGQWAALAALIGLDDAALGSVDARLAAHGRIDDALTVWAGTRTLRDAEVELGVAGVPAVACRPPSRLRFHPQFEARGFYEQVVHPAVGTHRMPGQPYRLRGVDRWIRHATPLLGQHNAEILTEIGLSADEIASLEESGSIGTTPRF